jgi:outer membrane protein TolC
MIWPNFVSHVSSTGRAASIRTRRRLATDENLRIFRAGQTESGVVPQFVQLFALFSLESPMSIKRASLSMVLILCLVAPLSAQSGWTEDFLLNFNPSARRTPQAAPPQNPVVAQIFQTGTVPISMQDVVNMMLDNNLDIRSNRFSPRSSALQTLVFYRALQPSIRFSGTLSRDTSASTSQLIGATSLSNLRHQFAVNFSQQLPWGTSLAIDATMNRQSNNSNNNTFNPSYVGLIRYTVGQHLLRDRGKLVNTRQIIVGQNNEKLSAIQFENQMINLIVTAQKTYWDLVFAGEDLKVKLRSLDLAQQTLSENQTKVQIGVLAPIEVKLSESEVANRQQQLIQSRGSVVTNEDQIKKLVSSETDPSLFLIGLSTNDAPRRPASVTVPTLEEGVRIAMENRLELRQTALELENRDVDVAYLKNQKLPILDVTATFTQNGTGGTRTIRTSQIGGQVTEVIPGGLTDAFGQLFGYGYLGNSIGFSLTIPLSNKAAVADYDRAVNERRLTQSRLDVARQQIALEVRNALTQIEQARASIDTARVARELAQEQVEAEQTKFNLGTSTLRFVLEEQRNLAQAETTELQSLVGFNKALVDLDKAMGLTLMKNNVQVDKAIQGNAVASRTLVERARSGN